MLTEQQVRDIFDAAFAKAKPFIKEGEIEEKKGKRPDFYPGYEDAVRTAEQIKVHIVPGTVGEHLIRDRSPNQTEAEFVYVSKNAKQVTLPVYQDFDNTVSRVVTPGNWDLLYPKENQAADDLREYLSEGIDEYDSVQNFVSYLLLKLKSVDPMGLLVVTPGELPTITREDGTQIVDGTMPLRPQIAYIESEYVWGYKADRWYLYQTEERSLVEYGNRQVRKGMVLMLVDDTRYWRIEQVGKLTDYEFEVTPGIEHGVTYPPADHLKGFPAFKEGKIVWQSVFLPAKDVLDLAYLDAQNLMVIKNACVYPHKVMVGDECDYVDGSVGCHGLGKLTYFDIGQDGNEFKRVIDCPQCKGTGSRSRMSPTGVLHIRPKSGSDNGEGKANEAIYFVEPSTANVEFLSKEVEKNMDVARSIMHLESETAQAGGTQPETATNAGLRNRATAAFIKPIADQMFDTIEFLVDAIARMRYPGQEAIYELVRPTIMDMRTEDDLVEEINVARKSDLSPAYVQNLEWQLYTLHFGNRPEALKAFEVITQADRLNGMTPTQIQAEATAKRAEPWEVVLHYSALSLWEALLREDPALLEKELAEKVTLLRDAAKAVTPASGAVNATAKLLADAVNA